MINALTLKLGEETLNHMVTPPPFNSATQLIPHMLCLTLRSNVCVSIETIESLCKLNEQPLHRCVRYVTGSVVNNVTTSKALDLLYRMNCGLIVISFLIN